MTLRLGDQCGQYLSELAVEDQRIWVLDADLADSDGALHFAKRHPDRFIMAGIAEQCMVSLAAGMASCGVRPWVFSFAAFLCYRAYDQIRVCISQSKQPVTLIGSHSGGCTGRNGKTHATLNDIALMVSLPNLQVWSPAEPNDLKLAMQTILADDKPAYLRLPRQEVEALPGQPAVCRWLSTPSPITLISTGLTTHLALKVREYLAQRGLPVGLLHCLQLSPLPEAVLYEAMQHVEWLFVIEDHYTFGGLASLIRQLEPRVRVTSIGWPKDWSGQSGKDQDLLRKYGMSAEQLAANISAMVQDLP